MNSGLYCYHSARFDDAERNRDTTTEVRWLRTRTRKLVPETNPFWNAGVESRGVPRSLVARPSDGWFCALFDWPGPCLGGGVPKLVAARFLGRRIFRSVYGTPHASKTTPAR